MSQRDFTDDSRQALLDIEGPVTLQSVLTAMLLLALFVANVSGLRSFVVVVVAVVALWAWDVAENAATADISVNPLPIVVAPAAAAWGAYRWGFDGFAVAMVGALAITLAWMILRTAHRSLRDLAATGLAVIVGATGAGALTLLRMRWNIEVNAFLAVMAAALATSLAARWLQVRYALFDPNIGALAAAAVVGLFAGLVSSLELSPVFVASVAAAGGLVAGQTAGSLLRSGRISLTEDAPGALSLMDGPLLAVGIFWLAMVTLST
jgi:uncharacterized membrane protein YjjB (DUF3815 family)